MSISDRQIAELSHHSREGGQGGGDTGIRGRRTGIKGTGIGDKGGGGRGKRGRGYGNFWGGCYTNICCILLILLYFYVLECNNWVSEVSNRRIEVNSGILTMNPALISLHRQGVFRKAWFTLTSFTSDFGLSLVDYFPLIPSRCFGGNPHF